MRGFTVLALAAVAGIGFTATVPEAEAQISINIGVAPECPYGYYDVAPYSCAPSGYYGPEWFASGVFIGAGPWFHGPATFRGYVNNSFDRSRGYRGPTPNRGEKAVASRRVSKTHFKGNEARDGRGHAISDKR
ncbi:MAG: hypothetical protein WBE92_03235 [Steroidobacteraceae bacterium]